MTKLSSQLNLFFLLVLTLAFSSNAKARKADLDTPLKSAKIMSFELKTKIDKNKNLRVCYRLPKGYSENRNILLKCRVLLYFGGRNQAARSQATGPVGFAQWADKNKVVIVGFGFKDADYWKIGEWSGKVIRKALTKISKDHPAIYTDKLLVIGYSAGSQASNSFAATFPQYIRAWASIGCGVWHKPTRQLRYIPGLIVTGDSDTRRYLISRAYYKKYLNKGYRVIWKCLHQTGHEIDREATGLASAFFDFYNELYRNELSTNYSIRYKVPKLMSISTKYIGGDIDQVFYDANSQDVRRIPKDERIYFPSLSIAENWGKKAVETPSSKVTHK